MSKFTLDRATLATILQGNARAIATFERVISSVGDVLPDSLEETNALANQALAVAQMNNALLSILLDALGQLDSAPARPPSIDADDHAPRAHLGTISSQNADAAEITGGTIDNTPIGATTAASGKFTTLAASSQITSTLATGAAPFTVASTTKVDNLYVDRAALADTATTASNAGHASSADSLGTAGSYPADATDLATVITLANFIKSRNTSKGI